MRAFDPWVGTSYRAGGVFGIRLLILGEAHYDQPEKLAASYTVDVVRTLGQRERFRFFTITQALVQGTRGRVSDAERTSFWERVAFCNFVQTFPGAGPRVRPTPEMWSAGREPFLQTVAELDPQLVLVLGKELQGHLPELPAGVRVCGVPHPSGQGFSHDEWQPVVRAAIVASGGIIPDAY